MVSEKVIIVLVIIAILLSGISIAVTILSMNSDLIPEIKSQEKVIPDSAEGRVGIEVLPPAAPPDS